MIGWLGVRSGVVLGLLLAFNVDTIVPFLEHTFRFQIMDADVYYITAIPSEVHCGNVRRHRRGGAAADRARHRLSGAARRAHRARRSAAL